MSKAPETGFTLVELMLAMALFSVILIVSTTGFIAINRTYTRGAIKKQLSESIQNLEGDVTTVYRNPQGPPIPCTQGAAISAQCGNNTFNMLCASGARYLWQNALDTDQYTGLYRDSGLCSSSAVPNISNATKIIDGRYIVADFNIVSLPNNLYEVNGVVRTADSNAQTISNNSGSINPSQPGWDPAVSPYKIKCKGSSAGSIVQTCAVQSFDFIINSRAIAP